MSEYLKGKKGLVIGIANEHSIAWGCARAFHAAGAELADPLHQVVSEGVQGVDEEDHRAPPSSCTPRAWAMAPSLCRVSKYSASGREARTTPAPAWMVAAPPE